MKIVICSYVGMWSLVLWVLVVKTVCIRYVSFNYVMCAVLKISARKKKIFYYRKSIPVK